MTDWNCARTEERLSDYLEGILSLAEAAEFSAHAGSCDACGKLVKQVRGLVHQMSALDALETPPQLIPKIIESTLGPRRKQSGGWQRWFARVPQFWQPQFAMGAITVAATILIVLYTTGISPAKLKKADLSPANVFRTANRQVHLTYARSAKFVNDLRVVYEIQTRLQPDAEPSPSITPAPAPQQNPQPPSSVNPQEKSQTSPHPGRSQSRNATMFASLLNTNWAGNFAAIMLGDTTRSPR